MKESVRNFIEILILIVVGGTWGFFCPRIFPNIALTMIFAILGGFVIGHVLAKLFIWIRNRKEK